MKETNNRTQVEAATEEQTLSPVLFTGGHHEVESLVKTAPAALLAIFEDDELLFLADMHKGVDFDPGINYRPQLVEMRILESEDLDSMEMKWEISLPGILAKLGTLSFEECFELVKWSSNFWNLQYN
ncbi:MAG: hypothetical protein GY754_42315 [bacterium]|nr:hypothetical protein [bacterium]